MTFVKRIAACVLIGACTGTREAPTAGTASPSQQSGALSVRVISGASQQAFAGDLVSAPIAVQIVDANARPVAGRRSVRFSIVNGGGSVSDSSVVSSDNGTASISWRLGATVGTQELAAQVSGAGGADTPIITPIFAEALSRDAADLVVVHGATKGPIGILVRQDAYAWTYTLSWPDTILRLLPHAPANDGPSGSPSWQEVTAFAYDHAPATAIQPWTSGIDTVSLILRPAIAVPFTVWISTDYDTTAARARWDLENVDTEWRNYMTGLRVGPVRFVNAPDLAVDCAVQRPPQFDPKSINLYYQSIQVDGFEGHTCDASMITVPPMTPYSFATTGPSRFVMTHSIGHALALEHVPDSSNVMISGVFGTRFNTGQIFRMHFDARSALNSVLGIHPPGERPDCRLPNSAHCPDQMFSVW